jgi:hypothetical protein
MVFAEWAERYMAGAVHLRASTRRAKRYSLDNHILPAFGSLPLIRITPLHIRRFIETLNAKMAPSSVRSVYIVLRALLTSAVDAEVVAVSPAGASSSLPNGQPPKRSLPQRPSTVSPRPSTPTTSR